MDLDKLEREHRQTVEFVKRWEPLLLELEKERGATGPALAARQASARPPSGEEGAVMRATPDAVTGSEQTPVSTETSHPSQAASEAAVGDDTQEYVGDDDTDDDDAEDSADFPRPGSKRKRKRK